MEEEVSAFAAYSAKKPKSLEKKKKLLSKKKKKFKEKNVNSLMNSLIKASEVSEFDNFSDKNMKKQTGKKHLIKSILKAQKDSLFKDCTVSKKVDNVFLKQNGNVNPENNVLENCVAAPKIKKLKNKKKKVNKELNFENMANNVEEENSFDRNKILKNDKTLIKENENLVAATEKESENNKETEKLPSVIYGDYTKIGEEVFSWIISPLSMKKFFQHCWEKKPVHIKHNNEKYFISLCSLDDFKLALRKHDMYFTKNIDITSYIDGTRRTENPEGKAKPALVWDFYRNGRSVRLLNPQTFIKNIQVLCSTLQEFFHCFVGANIYLTPPGTQGFAPHYDDIEAFVLQLEGEKLWKLYNPRSEEETLPRKSSRNFREDEIGDPILEVTLQPGDVLYFPRGIIHQARCLPHIHSLHVTVSCYQRNSWADLLEKVLPVALQKAINEDVELRKGLPIGYLNSFGMIYSDHNSALRQKMIKKFEKLTQKILDHCPLDAGIDQLGADFIHDALPPCLTSDERLHGADRDHKDNYKNLQKLLKNSVERNLSVKLIRGNCVRLVSEEEEMVLYFTTDNSLVYHENEAFRVCISTQWAQAVEYLIHSYPKFVPMKDLPVSGEVNKPGKWKNIVEFVYFLWQKDPMKDQVPMIQLPPTAGMDRLPLPMSFNASDLLLRYPLGFPAPSNQGYLSDFKLHLPASLATDPRLWSREDVVYFLRWCETEFDLPHFDMDLFQMNGKALCFLTKSDLNERCSWSGRVLHNVLQLLLRETNSVQRCLPSSPSTPPSRHPSYPFGPIPYGGWSLSDLYAQNAAHLMGSNPVTLSPAPSTDSQSRSPEHSSTDNQASSGFESGGSTGSHQSDSEEENFVDNSPPAAPPPASTSPSVNQKLGVPPHRQQQFFPSSPNDVSHEPNTNGRLLWDFLQQLLNDPAQRYTNFIAWKNHETGVFKIVDPAGLAKLWGIQKNHLSMNYDKMSRALRYYYRVNILRKVQGERHCYQFLRNPSELKSIKNISLLRQQISMQQQQQQQQQSQSVLPPPPPPTPLSTHSSITITPVKKEPVKEDMGVDRMSDGDGPTDLSTRFTQSPSPLKQEEGDKPTDLSIGEPTMHLSIVKSE